MDAATSTTYHAGMSNEHTEGGEPVRLTPYEMVFGHAYFEEDRFAASRDEAAALGAETSRPEEFVRLSSVTQLLQDLLPEGASGLDLEKHAQLLFQAYNFWRFGRSLWALEAGLARELVEPEPEVGSWELTPPDPAGYIQFPRHLFWSRIEEEASPEPVDGIFWTMVGEEDPARPPYSRIDVLLVLGMRADRAGFSTIVVSRDEFAQPLGHWADGPARPEGRDFENILPGGELQDWLGLLTEAEVLKLVSRIFWYTAANPDSIGAPSDPAASPSAPSHDLPPSRLSYRLIRRVGADG